MVSSNLALLWSVMPPSACIQSPRTASISACKLFQAQLAYGLIGATDGHASLEAELPADFPPVLHDSVSAGVQRRMRVLLAGLDK